MQDHPLAGSAFGGLAGWKLGAVGVVKGEPAISAPLFRKFVVDAPAGVVSAAAINMHRHLSRAREHILDNNAIV